MQDPRGTGPCTDERGSGAAFRLASAWGLLLVGAAVVVVVTVAVGRRVLAERSPFDVDEAEHANAAVELTSALRSGEPEGIVKAVTRQSYYPPVHSFLVTTSYLLRGEELASSRLPSLAMYVLAVLLLGALTYRALRRLQPETAAGWFPTFGTAIAIILAGSSPILIWYGALCMVENTGVVATILLFLACDELFARPHKVGLQLLVALCGLVLFLTKYNLALVVLPALVLTLRMMPWSLPERHRLLLRVIGPLALGVVIWLALIDRASFVSFFLGHPGDVPLLSSENLLFDIRAWLGVYGVHPVVGAGALLCAGYAAAIHYRKPIVRLTGFTALAAFGVLLISTTNEARYLLVAAPALWFLAALGGAEFVHRGAQRLRQPFRSLLYGMVPLVLVALWAVPAHSAWQRLPADLTREFEATPADGELQDFIFTRVPATAPLLLNGETDKFSTMALSFRGACEAHVPYTAMRIDAYPFRADRLFHTRMSHRNVQAPFRIPGFPTHPLEAVLGMDYYRYAVQLRSASFPEKAKAADIEFASVLARFESARATRGGHTVVIYTLP